MAQIKFPNPINVDQAEDFLKFLARRLSAKVSYRLEKEVQVGYPRRTIAGNIVYGKIFPGGSDEGHYDFTCINEDFNYGEEEGSETGLPLKLDTFHFAEPKNEIEHWEEINRVVKDYFANYL